jgi:hypothetical protein
VVLTESVGAVGGAFGLFKIGCCPAMIWAAVSRLCS